MATSAKDILKRIKDEEVERLSHCYDQCVFAVLEMIDNMTFLTQTTCDPGAQLFVVFKKQDTHVFSRDS